MSALMLRIVAIIAMLIDHIGYQYNIMAMRAIGRIAFPIFVYLLCNGYRHTSSRSRYAIRLGIFALISQIPYSLFGSGILWDSYGNVMVTLLMSLLCIWSAEELRMSNVTRWLALFPSLAVCIIYHFGIIGSDYGARGILMALVFYYFDGSTLKNRLLVLCGMLAAEFYPFILAVIKQIVFWLCGDCFAFPSISQWELYQMFALLSLIFIFTYNGEKGKYPNGKLPAKILQYGFYLFYPVHQLALWLIRVL